MEHTSRMLRLTLMGGQARVFLCDTTEMAQQARDIHEASNTCSAAMGRMLAATAIMGANLKSDGDRITATINGGGPAGPICAIAGPDGTVKVTIEHPEVELPLKPNGKLDVGGALGKDGQLTVMRSFGFGEPYVGRVALVSGEIAEDFAMYYLESEQTPSLCALGTLVGEKIISAFLFDSRNSEVWSSANEEELPSIHALALSTDGKGVRFSFASFVEPSKKNGRRYMRLGEGAQSFVVEAVRGREHLIVLTVQNRALICPIEEISFNSGCARGVQVIKLEEEDKLWESMVVNGADQGLMLSRVGTGTPVEVSLRKQKACARGGKGTLLIKRGKLQLQQKFYSNTTKDELESEHDSAELTEEAEMEADIFDPDLGL